MDKLDKDQYKTLKKIYKHNRVQYNSLSADEKNACDFLERMDFVEFEKEITLDKIMDTLDLEITCVCITESGKSKYYTLHEDKYRFTIPNIISTILSIIAIIISIFALLKP